MLSFLSNMFPQCPHPVASYTFDLTCRYLIKNNKGTFYASVIAYSGNLTHSLFKYMSLLTQQNNSGKVYNMILHLP